MPPVAGNNFAPVMQHLNTLKELLDKLSAKLGGVRNKPGGLTPVRNNGGLTPAGNNGGLNSSGNSSSSSAGNTGAAPLNNAYTFFGLTKNSTSNNLTSARTKKIKEYHADKHMQNKPENQEKFKGLYAQIQPKYAHLKAIFDARNAVAAAANQPAGNVSPAAAAPAIAAIENAKKATTLAIKNGTAENVSNAAAAANGAAAAASVAALGNNPLSAINVTAMTPNKKNLKPGQTGYVAAQKAKLNAKKGGRRTRKRRHTRKSHTRRH